MNSAPIFFFLDVIPQQTRTSRLPTWVWGISERSSTGQRSPTRPLPVYAPKTPSFQFGVCDRQGSHGQCSRLGVSRRKSLPEKSPSPMSRRNASTRPQTNRQLKKPANTSLCLPTPFAMQLGVPVV